MFIHGRIPAQSNVNRLSVPYSVTVAWTTMTCLERPSFAPSMASTADKIQTRMRISGILDDHPGEDLVPPRLSEVTSR
jgi:hypothetical protein